jgi:undecaprenyl pyrophosphate phosphatase UppP
VPAIAGAALLQILQLESWTRLVTVSNAFGFVAAFFSGLAALKILDTVIKHAKLHYFAAYCFLFSICLIAWQII